MDEYGPATYGDRIAAFYDDWYLERLDPTAAVDLLVDLAGDGRALELGIGTGRVALPLAVRGVSVSGIDASEKMVERLREKPGGKEIPVTFGNFADIAVDGTFRLIYVPFTTFFALLSQEAQLRCLRNIASRLEPGGHFVMDAFVPDLTRYRNNQALSAVAIETNLVMLDVSQHDPVSQVVRASHVVVTESGVHLVPVVLRYAWPAELDAMGLVAGLELADRYGDYDRSPFTASSTRHVSVYRKPAS